MRSSNAGKKAQPPVEKKYQLSSHENAALRIEYGADGVKTVKFALLCDIPAVTEGGKWDYEYTFKEYPDGKREFVGANLYTFSPYWRKESLTASGLRNTLLAGIDKIRTQKETDETYKKMLNVIYDGTISVP